MSRRRGEVFSSSPGRDIQTLSPDNSDKNYLKDSKLKNHKLILELINAPKMLLATILISNNVINIAIIIISSLLFSSYIAFNNAVLSFIFQIFLTTFLILLFGEVIPKTYANRKPLLVAEIMSVPLMVLQKILAPISNMLVKSTTLINHSFEKKSS